MESQLGAQVQSLRDLLDREERTNERIRADLTASDEILRRLRKAVAALTDEAPQRRKRESEASPSAGPREETVGRVWAVFAEAREPMTPTQVARAAGSTPATVQTCVKILRAEGRLRLVGKTRGGGRAYAAVVGPEPEPVLAEAA